MSEGYEQSYYEIALTTRPVRVALVGWLRAVLAAFFAGVWVGGGSPRSDAVASDSREAPPEVADAEAFDDPEEFEFFADRESPEPEPRPDLREVAENPDPETTLAEDLGVEDEGTEPEPEAAAGEAADPDATSSGTSGRSPREPPERDSETPASRAAQESEIQPGETQQDEIFVIQVFSSRDEIQARRLVTRLQEGGFEAFLSPESVEGTTMHRVRIGPFRQRSRADAVAERVRDRFKLDTWVTSP
ncbi:MAG: SPOR domain-containing protein [Thermoanaerobaculia bacterium]|nr:SPOR domain-containing protein [Thermoanaerobaculia bacterium]